MHNQKNSDSALSQWLIAVQDSAHLDKTIYGIALNMTHRVPWLRWIKKNANTIANSKKVGNNYLVIWKKKTYGIELFKHLISHKHCTFNLESSTLSSKTLSTPQYEEKKLDDMNHFVRI